ncbi:hypothetical protein GZH47_17120 [Paenibacillus rhizovicinus]|uniref:Uncharacterized protein n=1 Tax=Paenibacillus rhizovicinus TaxID=2704463 RepID=A0A6C0P1D9_9BACL|nr:hypothetical protein [Paenibacillus rhizovicinus]QHW32360.1 hypothetical protein GZH47_17120 [Paenibacillus rhizovicinus]
MEKGSQRYKVIIPIVVVIGFVLLLAIPAPTPELAVRKDLLLSFHPVKAVSARVTEGSIKNDPQYGDLYYASNAEASFIYVKKLKLGFGWYVASKGTGP